MTSTNTAAAAHSFYSKFEGERLIATMDWFIEKVG